MCGDSALSRKDIKQANKAVTPLDKCNSYTPEEHR